jgi:CO dehydrogenase nickel-insertion accessory protein CooC1
MGKGGSGKTSMRSIIFANYIARDTRRIGATSNNKLKKLIDLLNFMIIESILNNHTFDFLVI